MTLTEVTGTTSVICFLLGLTTVLRGVRRASRPRQAIHRMAAYPFGVAGLFGTLTLLDVLLNIREHFSAVSLSSWPLAVFLGAGIGALLAFLGEVARGLAARRSPR